MTPAASATTPCRRFRSVGEGSSSAERRGACPSSIWALPRLLRLPRLLWLLQSDAESATAGVCNAPVGPPFTMLRLVLALALTGAASATDVITVSGGSFTAPYYTFDGVEKWPDGTPKLEEFKTYRFEDGGVSSGHPFRLSGSLDASNPWSRTWSRYRSWSAT